MPNKQFSDEDVIIGKSVAITTGTPWSPNRKLRDPEGDIDFNKLHVASVTSAANAASAAIAKAVSAGFPKQLLSISAVESPSRQQTTTYSEVSVSFVRDTTDPLFFGVRIWFIGYQGSTSSVIVAEGDVSPVSFLVQTTGETVTVVGQPVAADGTPANFALAVRTTVALDGVVSAPPAPSIAQSLVGTPLGYQFSFNEVILTSQQDVIDSYRIYRNTVNDDTTATFITSFKHNPNPSGAIVFTDNLSTVASGLSYYYWVSAINTVGLESLKTAAQSGTVVGSVGSIPAVVSTPFKFTSTTTSTTITTSPSAFFTRADGTLTSIGATSLAVTGLVANNQSFYLPYWRESDQTLQWVKASDVMIPTITGTTFAAASSQHVQTASPGPITTGFTSEVWMKGTTAANQALLSNSAPQNTAAVTGKVMQSFVTSAGEITFSIWNGATWQTLTTSGASVLDGSWHHVVCSYDPSASSGTMNIFVDSLNTSDNVTFWTKTSTGTIAAISAYWHIGFAGGVVGAPLTANTFNSLTLSHAAIYPIALDAQDARAHFNAFVNIGETMYSTEVTYNGGELYWKLNEPSGTTAADSISGDTGTYINTPTLNQTSSVVTVLGSTAIAWPYVILAALQFQTLRIHTPLSLTGISSKTPATGTSTGGGGGSGGGGGRGGCFTGNTLVKTHNGPVAIRDFTPSHVLTARGTWRPAILVTHEAEPRVMHHMGNDEWVTPDHKVLHNGQWVPALNLFIETAEKNEQVFTLSVITGESVEPVQPHQSEHSFTLANGIVVTNIAYKP